MKRRALTRAERSEADWDALVSALKGAGLVLRGYARGEPMVPTNDMFAALQDIRDVLGGLPGDDDHPSGYFAA